LPLSERDARAFVAGAAYALRGYVSIDDRWAHARVFYARASMMIWQKDDSTKMLPRYHDIYEMLLRV